MIVKELGMLAVIFFLVWSLILSANPNERMERVCEPVNWTGRILSATTTMISPDYADDVDGVFKKLNNGCKYVIWSTFYKSDYEKWQAEQK